MCHECGDIEILAKALEPPDPRFPEIDRLVKAARRDWDRWGNDLVEAVMKTLGNGKNLPMSPSLEARIYELLAEHEQRLVTMFSGWLPGKGSVETNVIPFPGITKAPPLLVAWRLGRMRSYMRVHLPVKGNGPTLPEVVRQAMAVKLSPSDVAAMNYASRRAAVFMRRPAQEATGNILRTLTDKESARIREAISGGLRRKASPSELRSELHQALTGSPSLQNDLDRVVRTELHFAQAHGGYASLKAQAKDAGEEDPWVYKITSPRACTACRRIWGTNPSDPVKYRLSYLEGREAGNGNFGKKEKDWGPVIGPVHPNCTEGPLMYWHERLVPKIRQAGEAYLEAEKEAA